MSNQTGPDRFQLTVDTIQAFVSPAIGLIGVATNLLSLIIFTRVKRKDVSSTVQYLSVLAAFDLYNSGYYVVLHFSNHAMRTITGGQYYVHLLTLNNFACKFMRFTQASSISMSGWILTLFSLERCLAVCTPLKIAQMVDRRTRMKGLVVAFVISFVPNIVAITSFTIFAEKGIVQCYMENTYSMDMKAFVSLMQVCLMMGLPSILITSFNIAICRALFKQNEMKKTLTSGSGEMSKAEKKCIINLISISTLYVVAFMPHIVLWTVYNTLEQIQANTEESMNIQWGMFFKLAKVAESLAIVNYSFNFFIYHSTLDFYKDYTRRILSCGRAKPMAEPVTMTMSVSH